MIAVSEAPAPTIVTDVEASTTTASPKIPARACIHRRVELTFGNAPSDPAIVLQALFC
jgi:hypothetical protein